MQLKFVNLEGTGVIVCEHCYGTLLSFSPVKEHMLPMTHCPEPDCRKNSAGVPAPSLSELLTEWGTSGDTLATNLT